MMNRRNTIFFSSHNKYNSRTCHCNQNHTHDSALEAHYCDQLAVLVKAGEIKSYRTQVRYPLKMNGITITTHIVDFEVVDNDGKLQIHEVKGFATREWAIKHKLFLQCYPDIEYIVVRDSSSNRMQGLKELARKNKRRKPWESI